MTDIVERLRRTLLDRDNFPRMDSEKWLPVGLAKEAADEIERLRASETAWKLIAKQEWNTLPQTEKEAALQRALDDAVADTGEKNGI